MSKLHVIYVRISVKDENLLGSSSLQSQEHRCREYLSKKGISDADIHVFSDDGYSGGNLERPQLKKMMNWVICRRVRSVTITDVSRLSRETRDFLHLQALFTQYKIQLNTIDMQIDTNTAFGKYIMTLKSSFATLYRDQIIEDSKVAALSRAKRGLWNGTIPLGYKKSDCPGILEVDEDTCDLVVQIYKSYSKLGSIKALQDELKQRGHLRPEHTNHKGEYVPEIHYADSSLRRILRSHVYIGKREINRKNKNEDQSSLAEQEQYKCVQGQWEPIIDYPLWKQVQDRLDFNASRRGSTANVKHKRFILPGFLVCGECGIILNTDSAKNNSYFYYSHPDPNSSCSVTRWPAHKLELPALEALIKLCEESGILNDVLEQYQKRQNEIIGQTPRRIKQLEAKVKGLQRKRDALIKSLSDSNGSLAPSLVEPLQHTAKQLTLRKEELSQLRTLLKTQTVHDEDVQSLVNDIYTHLEKWTQFDPYFIRRILMHTVSRIEVHGNQNLKFCLVDHPKLKKAVS